MSAKHIGSSLDDFLKEEGTFDEAQTQVIKEVIAWQLEQAMKEQGISKSRMAVMLHTSRTQVNRLLDAENDVTLSTLQRAAVLVNRKLIIDLVPEGHETRIEAREHRADANPRTQHRASRVKCATRDSRRTEPV